MSGKGNERWCDVLLSDGRVCGALGQIILDGEDFCGAHMGASAHAYLRAVFTAGPGAALPEVKRPALPTVRNPLGAV